MEQMSERQRKLKIITVFGTRPDAIKMAPVVLEMGRHPDKVDLKIVVTGQHREMLEQVLSVFEIEPDHDLDIMQPRQSLFDITTRILGGMESVLKDVQPDMILAQGDTTTTFAAALAAFYQKVAFGHVEAGLRTDNKYDPFPEEMNRRLTSQLTDLHFAPTEAARENLLREGVPAEKVTVTGNTVIDALLAVARRPHEFDDPKLAQAAVSGRMILVTAHRRENWGEPMRGICRAIKFILRQHPDVNVVFSVHRNPIVREVVFPELENQERVLLIEPPDYVPFVHLMKSAYLILSDSGGVQEEAPSLGKPVLVLRRTTERPEGVSAGSARLVGTEPVAIASEVSRLLEYDPVYKEMAQVKNPYGDGKAAERIAETVLAYYQL
jgi:UDP-N-acetylglucosamine 2-epimerase (non-hydrolysing)